MRDAEIAAAFEHREAARHADGMATRIGDAYRHAALARLTNRAQQQGQREQDAEAGEDQAREVGHAGLQGCRGNPGRGEQGLADLLVLHQHRDRAPALNEAEQGAERHQQGQRIRDQRAARIPGLHAQPEIHADAAMHPGDQQKRNLIEAKIGAL